MANKIQVKRSAVANKVPTTADLDLGEIAINTNDGKMYIKKDNGTASIVQVGAATGDVVGPSSATDNALARFDTTTGKIIQNGVVTEDDLGRMANILAQQFGDGTAESVAAGKIWYNGTTGSWNAGMGGGNITQQIGEELFIYGKASSAISDTNLQLVYQTGTVGASGVIQFAPTTSGITDSNLIVGVATEPIALNGFGRVTAWGIVHGIDTTGSAYSETWANNDVIWYNPVTGGLTKTKPSAPNIKVQIGTIINAGNGGSGSFSVEINHGSTLGGTDSNVQINGVASGNFLIYDASAGYWKNANITAGTGVSVTNGAGSVTIANTGVTSITGTASQVTASASTGGVTLSLPATINVNTSGNAATATTATNVSGTVAIANGGTGATTAATARTNLGATTVGGNMFTLTNPSAITFPRFNADNTVSALDAATFRTAIGAGAGTVTSVTGTAPIASSGGSTPAISLNAGYGDTQNPYASKTANFVLAAPNGAAGAPTFRAIVAADIPTLNQNTTGTASNVTGTVAIANGGSGTTTAQGAMNAFAGAVTSGSYLRGNGTNVVMSTIQAADVPTLNQNTTGSAATLTTARSINVVSFNGSADITIPRVKSIDDRALAPADVTTGYATFAFGSWANNSTSPYADTWVMRSYTDATGGNDNMVMFRKDALGMRVWQQSWNSATAFATYKDVAWTDGTNATGTWTINTSGSAATLTTGRTIAMTGDVTYTSPSFNGSANVTAAATLANSGVTAGTYMSPKVTVDAKGRLTSAASAVMTSTDNFLTITQTATGYNFAQYVPPPPDWVTLQSSTLGNLSTTIAMPSGFTAGPSGTAQMILTGSTNGSSFGSSLSPGTWSNTFYGGGWSTFQSPSGYVASNTFSSIANPSTIYSPAPTSGISLVYMVYPGRNGINTTTTTFLGSSPSSWGNGFGTNVYISGPSPNGTSRRLYAVLMVMSSNIGTISSTLTGATITSTTDSFTNTTCICVSITNNSSISTALMGTAIVSWMNSNSYYGTIWVEHTP